MVEYLFISSVMNGIEDYYVAWSLKHTMWHWLWCAVLLIEVFKKDLYTCRWGNLINPYWKHKTPASIYTRIKLHWNSQIMNSSTLDVAAETFVHSWWSSEGLELKSKNPHAALPRQSLVLFTVSKISAPSETKVCKPSPEATYFTSARSDRTSVSSDLIYISFIFIVLFLSAL
jgi:hypothetical protein